MSQRLSQVNVEQQQREQQVYFSHFAQLNRYIMRNKNKIGEHWLPRITEKLIMIGSQFKHIFTTSLGRHTQ